MLKSLLSVTVWMCVALQGTVRADTPANCTFDDVKGLWTFYEGPRGNDNTLTCSDSTPLATNFSITLAFPDKAIDSNGNIGFWTLIYNQGFEVVINNRKYFAFSDYDGNNSYCHQTKWGWSHKTGVNPSDWACYTAIYHRCARKVNTKCDPKPHTITKQSNRQLEKLWANKKYTKNAAFVEQINAVQSLWKATHYEFLENMKISDLVKMAGGRNSQIASKPKPQPVSDETRKLAANLPDHFDWRNINNVSYVSPVRNQGNCGSCFAFASMAMNEARLRIRSLNTQQTIYSPQDIVECSEYAQGCEGGFPYLIGGKYAEDFGLVAEQCNPYKGVDSSCSTNVGCVRKYSTNYQYVGGFYGACNEALMRIELVNNGPIVVGFEVYPDFVTYKSGIYHHTFVREQKNFKFNPFELTNHAVLVVGYGTDANSGQDFWIVKNSWSENWGENGYFRIRRGNDECAIESLAVSAEVVL